MNVLLTGGAGYIGSHLIRTLQAAGHECVVVDNLSNGHKAAAGGARLLVFELGDGERLRAVLRDNKIELVIHLAAFIEAGESVKKPDKYFHNNTMIGLTLLDAMRDTGVNKIVFSSTAAVYGTPHASPILETFPIQAINPYGESKVMVETLLRWFDQIHGLTSVCLRYFNASGADPEGVLGEEHKPETHLIPLVLDAVKTGRPITVFGGDYATPDGTCIRDYIHVYDLAQAHILALDHLLSGGPSDQFNVGTGAGSSVLEIIRTVEEVTGKKVPYVIGTRRDGDPPALVASSQKLRDRLGWSPQYSALRTIVAHAWNFANRA